MTPADPTPDIATLVDRVARHLANDEGLGYLYNDAKWAYVKSDRPEWYAEWCEQARALLAGPEQAGRDWKREHDTVHLSDDELFRDCPECVAEVAAGKARWSE
jgi:hypothetical protein